MAAVRRPYSPICVFILCKTIIIFNSAVSTVGDVYDSYVQMYMVGVPLLAHVIY